MCRYQWEDPRRRHQLISRMASPLAKGDTLQWPSDWWKAAN